MRNMLVVSSIVLTGCAAQQLSPEAKQVRVISPAVATQCKHLGLTQSFQPIIAGGMSAAQIDLRNKVAAAGGNAYVVSHQSVDYQGHADITADAYTCP